MLINSFAQKATLVLVLAVASASAQAQTLGDTLAGAYKHSGLLDQNRALLRAADEDVAIAVSALRPIINWSSSLSRTVTRSNTATTGFRTVTSGQTVAEIGVTASLVIFDSGANRLGVEAAKEAVLATRQGLISVEQQVLLRSAAAFFNVIRAERSLALRNNNVRVLREEARAASDRFEVGEVTRTDVALADARVAAARGALSSAKGELERAREEYAAAVGFRPKKLRAPKSMPRTAKSEKSAKSIALRTHPAMRQVQHEVAAAEIAIKRAEAAMNPTVSIEGRLSASEAAGTQNSVRQGRVGITAGGAIYHGGRLSALLRQAQARRDAVRGSLHTTRHNVRLDVANAWENVRIADANLKASKQQVKASRVAFNGVREEARLGARTTLEVLDAEQNLLDSQTAVVSAEADKSIAIFTLLSTMGLLTADHLKLKVRQYDPSEYYNLVKDAPVQSRQGQKLDRVLKALGKD